MTNIVQSFVIPGTSLPKGSLNRSSTELLDSRQTNHNLIDGLKMHFIKYGFLLTGDNLALDI